jgi:hypothetical protein
MDSIPYFTLADIETVRQIIHQRYRETIQIQLADSELMLNPKRKPWVVCPTLYWHVHGANFVMIRSGLNRFRCQFFYTPHNQYGTDQEEYDSLEQCVTALLQVQADHERGHGLS